MNTFASSDGGLQSFPAPAGHLRRRAGIGPTAGPRQSEQETEQFLGWLFPWTASTTCCSDADIARALGIALDASRNGLFGFDSAFSGPDGAAFAARIGDAARRVGLDPGLLATNLLAEIQDRATWMSPAPLQSHQVGVNYWHEERTRIRGAVREATAIRESIVRDAARPARSTSSTNGATTPGRSTSSPLVATGCWPWPALLRIGTSGSDIRSGPVCTTGCPLPSASPLRGWRSTPG